MSISLFLFLCAVLAAQTTKVRGRITDAADGQGVPFAAVFFADSEVGVSADMDGYFTLTTRDMDLITVCVQQLGYQSVYVGVKAGAFNEINIALHQQENKLGAVTVKADNHKARRLLAAIDAHRARNNPETREDYRCNVYSKMELDITHPREQLRGRALNRQWGFIFDYVDTSDISGIPYLPVMINESYTQRSHSVNPDMGREVILAHRLSGADPDGNNLLSQFTGSMNLRNNFYDQFMSVFNVELPSPINSGGMLFYNYFIIDSMQVDARKTYLVRYHPKPGISTPAFDGEMYIDAKDFALRRMKAKMVSGQNMNWVRDLVIESEYECHADSLWFYKSDRFYADFSMFTSDSSKVISFIGNRTLEFSNPEFGVSDADANALVTTIAADAASKDEEFWAQTRPYELSDKEKDIYNMVERVQETPLYRTWYDIVATVINGYWDVGNIGFGHILKIVGFNPLEGFKASFGIRTSPQWSKQDRVGGYIAYGFRDRMPKGGFSYEHMFSKEPTKKLMMELKYDVKQLGRPQANTAAVFTDGNILSSIFGAGRTQKLCPVAEFYINYDSEYASWFNVAYNLSYNEFYGNSFVPMQRPGVGMVKSIPSVNARLALRFSKDEVVNRGHFIKKYLNSPYPAVTISLNAGAISLYDGPSFTGIGSLGKSSFYFRPEITMDWKAKIPPIGVSDINVNIGTIVGKVPYTHLHIHEGNGSYFLDPGAFSTMDFFEFASDTWATVMIDHNFYGFFLGKIPYLKKLQLREAVIVKATWGMLGRRNDGINPADSQAMLLFPHGMHSFGKVPYVEAGFAITNIFRLLRVDFLWRCTHRDAPRERPRNFVVNVGVELKF